VYLLAGLVTLFLLGASIFLLVYVNYNWFKFKFAWFHCVYNSCVPSTILLVVYRDNTTQRKPRNGTVISATWFSVQVVLQVFKFEFTIVYFIRWFCIVLNVTFEGKITWNWVPESYSTDSSCYVVQIFRFEKHIWFWYVIFSLPLLFAAEHFLDLISVTLISVILCECTSYNRVY